jgi:hypothetical protein
MSGLRHRRRAKQLIDAAAIVNKPNRTVRTEPKNNNQFASQFISPT